MPRSSVAREGFGAASGRYFDNDAGRFVPPHPDALDERKGEALMRALDALLKERSAPGSSR